VALSAVGDEELLAKPGVGSLALTRLTRMAAAAEQCDVGGQCVNPRGVKVTGPRGCSAAGSLATSGRC
jgi:hypothetical protein